MSATANYKCPSADCGGLLEQANSAGGRYTCRDCGESVHEAVAENADWLTQLADHEELRSAEWAQKLLETGGVR